jgi:uncharacterized protein (UPF0332 family)
LNSARTLAAAEDWNGAVDRLFYACEYALKAVLGDRGLNAKGHAGREHLMHMHLIRPGILEARLGSAYRTLSVERLRADYEDGVLFDAEDFGPLLDLAQEFTAALRRLA